MAASTVELGRLITKTNFKLFDFSYTFDDLTFKEQLEQQIIDFYYDYEIGFETPDMFKRKFIARWQRIIPYYNKLYNTTLLNYNPLSNYSISEALDQLASSTNVTDSTGNAHSFTDSVTKASDYPQQSITGGDYLQGESNTISDTTTTDNGKTTATGSANSNYTKTIEGLTGGSYPELIKQHRSALIRITDMVINELKPCFILVH